MTTTQTDDTLRAFLGADILTFRLPPPPAIPRECAATIPPPARRAAA